MRIYNFSKVRGNYATLAMIKSSLTTNTFPNFSMMIGSSGTGKSTCAEIAGLRLLCENPNGVEPCLKCRSCLVGISALQNKGKSRKISKINVGDRNKSEDVKEMIGSIFNIDAGDERVVFILEEVHTLVDNLQTAFLEEIDKLPENVFVIMCTTKEKSMIEELKKRAVKFRFKTLDPNDSQILLDKTLEERGKVLSQNIKDLILRNSKGTPRDIVETTNFIIEQPNVPEDLVIEFLGEINRKQLQMLLENYTNLQSYYNQLNILLSKFSPNDIIYNLKSYISDLHFLSVGLPPRYANMSPGDNRLAKQLGEEIISKMLDFLYRVKYNADEVDLNIVLMKMRDIMSVTPIPNNPVADQITKSKQLSDVNKEINHSTSNPIIVDKIDELGLSHIFGKK